MYTYAISEHALHDMQSIGDYIAFELCAPESANALLDLFEQAFEKACAFPLSLPLLNDNNLSQKNYRKIIVKNYIIFVIPDEKTETLYIMRILFHAQNYRNYL